MKEILQQNANITSNSKQLALLKKHFPNCFDASGSFIVAKLQEITQEAGG